MSLEQKGSAERTELFMLPAGAFPLPFPVPGSQRSLGAECGTSSFREAGSAPQNAHCGHVLLANDGVQSVWDLTGMTGVENLGILRLDSARSSHHLRIIK